MTSQKLFEALQLMVDLDAKLKLQTSLDQIKDNLANLAGQPGQTQFQTALTSALLAFTNGAHQLPNEITPSQFGTIAGLGGAEFFDPSIADKIEDKIEHNAMTPTVARDFVLDIAKRRTAFLQTVNTTLDGLKQLLPTKEPEAEFAPGEAAFIIPRDLFHNLLGDFVKELSFISSMTDYMSEAVTGEIQPAKLEYLASSFPVVAIGANLGLLTLLAKVISSFLDAWKKVEEIREIRERLKAVGASGTASEEMDERITTTVEQVVEDSTKLALSAYNKDSARKNELENGLRIAFHRLFGQIERGLTVEIRTHEPVNADQSNATESAALADLAKSLVFPVAAKMPMLLTSSEILEGEVASKKVTTARTIRKKPGSPAAS